MSQFDITSTGSTNDISSGVIRVDLPSPYNFIIDQIKIIRVDIDKVRKKIDLYEKNRDMALDQMCCKMVIYCLYFTSLNHNPLSG